MPKKAVETTPERVQASKDIGAVVYHFYTTFKACRPDSTHYASGRKILEALMYPTDPNVRTYTQQEIIKALNELSTTGVHIMTLNILMWPDLLRAFVDNDRHAKRLIVEAIRQAQKSQGIQNDAIGKTPKGW